MAVDDHTYVSWRDYVDARFAAMQQAVNKAEAASEARFAGVNEFRAQLGDQTRTLLPRLEAEQKFKSMDDKIAILENRVNSREDRGRGMGEVWGWIFGAAGIVALLFSLAKFYGK